MLNNLSVALAVRNEEKNLPACLDAVKGFAAEIVIVDGSSTDNTVSVAKSYGAKVIVTDNPAMFHINKQKALDASSKEWILQLDADEVVTDALKLEITSLLSSVPVPHAGYAIPRRNYFWGHFMRKGGQYPDEVIRLVRKDAARFPCKSVHEQIEIRGTVGHLKEPMLHYSYRTRADYWKKADAYTSLAAQDMKKEGVKKGFGAWLTYCVVKPVITFLLLYIRHKGFVDGLAGFEFALYSGRHHCIAYRKMTALP